MSSHEKSPGVGKRKKLRTKDRLSGLDMLKEWPLRKEV